MLEAYDKGVFVDAAAREGDDVLFVCGGSLSLVALACAQTKGGLSGVGYAIGRIVNYK